MSTKRMRLLMADFLAKRQIATADLSYYRLKLACIGELGLEGAVVPHHRVIRQAICEQIGKAVALPKQEFYDTDEWRRARYKALKLHGGSCQCCGARGSRGTPLHIDHIKPRSKFPELELDLSNLQVLCKNCNLGKGAWDQTDWRPAAIGAAS